MSIAIIFSKIVFYIRKRTFLIDPNIPNGYLVSYIFNKIGELLYGRLIFLFRKSNCFIHYTSKIKCKKRFSFGSNMMIDRNCYIDALSTEGIKLGKNVSIGKNSTIECTGSLRWIGKGLQIGNNVGLGTHGFFGCAGGIIIGDDTILGNYVSFHSENHVFKKIDIPIKEQGVTHKGIHVGSNCWIGAKVTILDGASIGNGCIVAAGSIVTAKFPNNCIIGGVPAKILKYRN